jgi:ATP-binding protein involved in chromosome partitioning
MLREVEWGSLDVIVVDMPPGTGDAQLTMAQQVPLRGAVIVSTPQDLALIDARRGVAMFKRVNVPILGIVENMSYFACPSCGTRSDIFGHGGAHAEAQRLGVPFLGEVPLHIDIREKSDAGLPVVATDPDGPHAKIYREIATHLRDQLRGGSAARAAPKIVIEAKSNSRKSAQRFSVRDCVESKSNSRKSAQRFSARDCVENKSNSRKSAQRSSARNCLK